MTKLRPGSEEVNTPREIFLPSVRHNASYLHKKLLGLVALVNSAIIRKIKVAWSFSW